VRPAVLAHLVDHPIEIKSGMVFALETQHGKMAVGRAHRRDADRARRSHQIISNFPVKQITVVDPIPGYGDHVR
jgi:hypothetical protein